MQTLENTKFGYTFNGQVTEFKFRYTSPKDEMFKRMKSITLRQQTFVFVNKQGELSYFIIGAFPSNLMDRFKTILKRAK
jgi:hypothetical protein